MVKLRSSALGIVCALFCVPASAAAQAPGPALSPAEQEAYDMSLQMQFPCSPGRQQSVRGSESLIERAAGALSGTAAFLRTPEGTFLVLEGYDENQAGHCMVLAWFGGELTPGRHPIRQLSMSAMEEELDSGEHSFFTFSAVRSPEESAVFVSDSGSVQIESMESDSVVGTFEITGFTINSQARQDDIGLHGSFTALATDG